MHREDGGVKWTLLFDGQEELILWNQKLLPTAILGASAEPQELVARGGYTDYDTSARWAEPGMLYGAYHTPDGLRIVPETEHPFYFYRAGGVHGTTSREEWQLRGIGPLGPGSKCLSTRCGTDTKPLLLAAKEHGWTAPVVRAWLLRDIPPELWLPPVPLLAETP